VYRAPSKDWDHDHCEFCYATFAEHDLPGVLHAGDTTPDRHRWIHADCARGFRGGVRLRILEIAGGVTRPPGPTGSRGFRARGGSCRRRVREIAGRRRAQPAGA